MTEPPLLPQASVHDFGPAESGVSVCARCGFVATLNNLDDVPVWCEELTIPEKWWTSHPET